jgi:hypothetical protein
MTPLSLNPFTVKYRSVARVVSKRKTHAQAGDNDSQSDGAAENGLSAKETSP